MAKWAEIKCPRCEELEAKLRKSALQELSALGQASEAYQAQKAAEAKLAQQDDLVQAAVAASLREAAGIASYHQDWGDAQSAILNLITPDAQAALDRALASERERCAEQAESHKPSTSLLSERYWRGVDEAAHSIAAAIREGQE